MSSHAISQKQMVRSQNELIRKNISAINEAQRSEAQMRSPTDRIADRITAFSGSMLFVLLHIVWFGVWVLLNVGLIHIPQVSEFDPFPFGLLTMIVSLEAIFLSTFVLISQNRMAKLAEQRAELDLHVNLLAEQKATKALEMLDQITSQLSTISRFNFKDDPEVAALKVSPEPQEVLGAIKEAVNEEAKAVKQQVREAVSEITDEMEAVRADVREITGETEAIGREVAQVDEKVEAVAEGMREVKQELKEKTGEHEEVLVG
ncbi:MAG TPA: DUF1003 domain-containing protein [Pyrinomonadaceae bacterium]|jgi:uncharacterized membrane protein